jgi:hypothetical protein
MVQFFVAILHATLIFLKFHKDNETDYECQKERVLSAVIEE